VHDCSYIVTQIGIAHNHMLHVLLHYLLKWRT